MSDPLVMLANDIKALRQRIETLEAQEDATRLSRLTIGGGAAYVTVASTGSSTFTGAIILTRAAATIASGAVAATGSAMIIDTEGAAASDDLDTISGGSAGQILIINCASNARDVVVKHSTGSGNIFLSGRADFTLTGVRDVLMLFCNGTEWREVGRGDNAV